MDSGSGWIMDITEYHGLRLFEQVWNGASMAAGPDGPWSMVAHNGLGGPKGLQRGPKGVPNGGTPPLEPCLTYPIMAIMANCDLGWSIRIQDDPEVVQTCPIVLRYVQYHLLRPFMDHSGPWMMSNIGSSLT